MQTQQYKRTLAGSVGAGVGAIFNGSGRTYYILEHKTETNFHHAGESQKIIVDQIELGRESSCQVRFDEDCETVSRKHAAIVKEGEQYKIVPLSTTNGTFVNGQRITGETILNSGDEIKLSSHGPVMGFIIPQGAKSLVSSIGMTERLSLFRKQALRPYKTALTVLSIVLVLAIAGLVGWNLYQAKQYDEKLAAQQQVVDGLNNDLAEQQNLVNDLQNQANAADQEVAAAKAELAALTDATEAQKAAAEAAIAAATEKAEKARQAAAAASRRASEIEKERDNATTNLIIIQNEKEEAAPAPVVEEEEPVVIEDQAISECYNSVYFVKINKIEVFDKDNRSIISFNTEGKFGGTGFLLDNGKFVTARRVVEPWYYYKNGVVGYVKDNKWTYNDLQWLANNGCKVVSNCTAISPAGTQFKFDSSDMDMKPLHHTLSTVVESTHILVEDFTPLGYVKRTLSKASVRTLYWYDTDHRHDWATIWEKGELATVKGLPYNYSGSEKMKQSTDVMLLGYPQKVNLTSNKVAVEEMTNAINMTGLNIDGVIEMQGRRWVEGLDGAPMLVMQNGVWTVMGILSRSDKDERDLATPIVNISMN